MAWTVVLDIQLIREITTWPPDRRKQVAMIMRLLEQDGPLSLGGREQVSTQRNIFVPFPESFYRLTLEVREGRTLIIREVVHFTRPAWI